MNLSASQLSTSAEDQQLLVSMMQGDIDAYTQLYHRYSGVLYIFVYKRLHNKEEAQDIVQELFLNLWQKRTTIQIRTTFSGYLFISARNRILDLISHKQVSQRYIESFQLHINHLEQYATDYKVRQTLLQELIDREIAALPGKMRAVFELSRKSSLSRREIADELGLSEQTVKSHLHHALKILKLKLGSIMSIVI